MPATKLDGLSERSMNLTRRSDDETAIEDPAQYDTAQQLEVLRAKLMTNRQNALVAANTTTNGDGIAEAHPGEETMRVPNTTGATGIQQTPPTGPAASNAAAQQKQHDGGPNDDIPPMIFGNWQSRVDAPSGTTPSKAQAGGTGVKLTTSSATVDSSDTPASWLPGGQVPVPAHQQNAVVTQAGAGRDITIKGAATTRRQRFGIPRELPKLGRPKVNAGSAVAAPQPMGVADRLTQQKPSPISIDTLMNGKTDTGTESGLAKDDNADLALWLEITGYNDNPHRENKLKAYRKRVEITEKREMLLKQQKALEEQFAELATLEAQDAAHTPVYGQPLRAGSVLARRDSLVAMPPPPSLPNKAIKSIDSSPGIVPTSPTTQVATQTVAGAKKRSHSPDRETGHGQPLSNKRPRSSSPFSGWGPPRPTERNGRGGFEQNRR